MKVTFSNFVLALFLFFLFCLFPNNSIFSQTDFGIGLQGGSPSGITAKLHDPRGMSLEFLAAWDKRRDQFFLNVHGLWETELGGGPIHIIYGPGFFAGGERLRDTYRRGYFFVAGGTANVGLQLTFGQLETYGQLTPRLSVIGNFMLALGGGLGVRVYFY